MFTIGQPPYLECSTAGDKRFSSFCAYVNGSSIESQYQAAKILPDGRTVLHWREAKNQPAVNILACRALYDKLWVQYLCECPHLIPIIKAASGLSDRFGKAGDTCQAETLWRIRNHQLPLIWVANKKSYKGPGEYIGRPSPLGNPYAVPKSPCGICSGRGYVQCAIPFSQPPTYTPPELCPSCGHLRTNSINQYEAWLNDQLCLNSPALAEMCRLTNIYKQQQYLILICWCSPLPCHGDIIKKKIANCITRTV